jgi:hypothetical protein
MSKWEPTRDKVSKAKLGARSRIKEDPPNVVQRETDHGRDSVYDYELKVYRWMHTLRYRIHSIDEMRKLCDKIMQDPRVQAIDPYPKEPYVIQKTWGKTANARVWERRIRFPIPTSNFSAMHEIAHLLTPGNHHGRQFMETEAKLFGWFCHPEAEKIMLEEIEKNFGKKR